jgi:hypothetical protein
MKRKMACLLLLVFTMLILAGCSFFGCKKKETTARLHFMLTGVDGSETEWAEVIYYPETTKNPGRPIEMPDEPQKNGAYFNGWEVRDNYGGWQLSGLLRRERPLRLMANGFLFYLPDYDYYVDAVFCDGEIPDIYDVDFDKVSSNLSNISTDGDTVICELSKYNYSVSIRNIIEQAVYYKYSWKLYAADQTEPCITATQDQLIRNSQYGAITIKEPTSFMLTVSDPNGDTAGIAVYYINFVAYSADEDEADLLNE